MMRNILIVAWLMQIGAALAAPVYSENPPKDNDPMPAILSPAQPHWLVHRTAMDPEFRFPSQNVTAIEYPSKEICEAQAKWLRRSLLDPVKIKARMADKVIVTIMAACTPDKPIWWEGN